jgi:hypothetical protein
MTSVNELKKMIESGESESIEFKNSGILSNTNELAFLMTAFANANGGFLLIGVNDDGTTEGMSARKGHQELIMSVARDKCDPPLLPNFETLSYNQSDVYVIRITKSQGVPHGVKISKGLAFYTRVGSTVRSMSALEMLGRNTKFKTRRKFIAGAIGAAVVVAAGYPYLQKSNPNQTLQTTATSLLSGTENLVTNGGFEDGMAGWHIGTGATPATAYVTSKLANSGTNSLHLQSNEGVFQDLPATSLSRKMTLSYFVYFEPQADLIPSSFVGLYTPDNSISRIFVVTRFPNSKSLPYQMSNLPNAVFRQFDISFAQWTPIIIDVSDFFTAVERKSFPLTRIGLESSNSNGLYYDDVKILLS